jgi:sugar lactone lactonase YvrE
MLNGDILTLDRVGQVTRRHVSKVVAALRPRRQGGLVIAVERGFALIDADGAISPIVEAFSDPDIRMNDGGCDRNGRFFCGSMAHDMGQGRGALYRFDPDGQVSTVLASVTISNGIAWTLEGTEVYYVDSGTGRVDIFSYDSRAAILEDRRPFVAIPADQGMPDGIALDAEGGLWVALWGGSAVHRYAPDGTLDAVVELPVSQVTACAFGGEKLTELYITTSQMDVEPGGQAAAGALFRLDTDVQGLEVGEFAG